MYPQSMFEQKYENSQKLSTENCHFYSHEKLLYVAWACFRNDLNLSSSMALHRKSERKNMFDGKMSAGTAP